MHKLIALAAEKAAEALLKGSRILILGGRTTNFPSHLRANPRVTFWDSTDPDIGRPKMLPNDTGLVLMTRFNYHKLTDRIRIECERLNALLIGPLGTGQITKLLEDAINELRDERMDAIAEVVTQEQKPDYTELPEFLIDQIPSNALGSDLLSSDATLEQLRQKAEQRWPGITTQRVHRALRHALYELDLFEVVADEPAADTEEIAEEKNEQLQKIGRLEQQLGELHAKLDSANGERRKQKEELKKLDSQLRQKAKDLKLILTMFKNLLQGYVDAGASFAFNNDEARLELIRIMNEHAPSTHDIS